MSAQSKPASIRNAKQLGEVIRERRKAAGLTQQEIAALGGLGARFLSELERGKPTAQIGKILVVLQLLGLELKLEPRK